MTTVERIHSTGSRLYSYPFRIYFLDHTGDGAGETVISVPKKIYKRAVKRNLIRRRTREALRVVRKERPELSGKDLLIVYVANEILEYGKIVEGLGNAMEKVLQNPA